MRVRSFALLVAFLLSVAAGAQAPSLPAPEAFFGHRMGADRELADWPALQRYFETIAAASDRVELVDAGPTTEGRRLIAAIVSSPDNIKRLEEIRANSLRLADPRTLDEAAAQRHRRAATGHRRARHEHSCHRDRRHANRAGAAAHAGDITRSRDHEITK